MGADLPRELNPTGRTAYVLRGHAFARSTTQGYIGAQNTRSKDPCCPTARFMTYNCPSYSPSPAAIRNKKAVSESEGVSFLIFY